MHTSGLLAMLLSSTLFATPKATAPKADAPTPSRSASTTEIELEVVEGSGGKPSSFGFVVPIDGSVEAFVDRGDAPRHCQVEVDRVASGLRLELDCKGNPAQSLKVQATRTLAAGTRTRIAEVKRPGGAKSQVFVTLR